jgi:hypothetical protein
LPGGLAIAIENLSCDDANAQLVPGGPVGQMVETAIAQQAALTGSGAHGQQPAQPSTAQVSGDAPSDGGSAAPTRRERKPLPFIDEISILPTVFGKGLGNPVKMSGGGTHVDIQMGADVWNAKKGWKPYGPYRARERMARIPFKKVDVTKPLDAVKAILFNAELKPFTRYVLKLTPEQHAAMVKHLKDREGVPKGLTHTCVSATSVMLKEVLGVEIPFMASQSPKSFAFWMEAQAKAGAPWIQRVEQVGEIKWHHHYMRTVKSVYQFGGMAAAAGGAGYGLFRAASSVFGDDEDAAKKTEGQVFDLVMPSDEGGEATEQ